MSLRVSMWLFLNFDSQVQNGFFFKNCDIKEFPPKKWKIGQIYDSKMKFSKKKKVSKKKRDKIIQEKTLVKWLLLSTFEM